MGTEHVIYLEPYPFEIGQKIHIKSGHRRGDWEVIGVSEKKLKLKCPVSHKEFEWDRFCYYTDEKDDVEWPARD